MLSLKFPGNFKIRCVPIFYLLRCPSPLRSICAIPAPSTPHPSEIYPNYGGVHGKKIGGGEVAREEASELEELAAKIQWHIQHIHKF